MIAGGGGARGWVGLRSVRNRWLWVGGTEGGVALEVVLGGGGAKEPRVAGRGGVGLMIDRCVVWSVSGRG